MRDFPGHITCDGDSRSEIVVPILVNRQVSMLPSKGLELSQEGPMEDVRLQS